MANIPISLDEYLQLSRCPTMVEWNMMADLIGLSNEDKAIALIYLRWPKMV